MIDTLLPLILLAVLALGFVLVPVLRLRKGEAGRELHHRAEQNKLLFAQRMQELEQEVRDGTVGNEDYQRMVAELQRAFLSDMQAVSAVSSGQGKSGLAWLPAGLALVAILGAAVMYHYRGSLADLALPAVMKDISAAQDEAAQKAAIEKLAGVLAERMERRPADLQGGYMLGTLYLGMEKYDEAAVVFRKMLEQMKPTPDRATVLGQLAQTLYLKAMNEITPEVKAIMYEATALNPNERSVMGLYGVDAFLKRDFLAALKFWRRQLSDLQVGSRDAEELRQRITAVEANLPEELKAAAQGPKLTVVVDIAPELKEKVTADMRLFVYARNPKMPMPIVADNKALPEFPITLTLDNSMSMTGMTLDSTPQLLVGARLSKSGTAIAQSGDLQVVSEPFELSTQSAPLKLTINAVVP